VKTGSTRV